MLHPLDAHRGRGARPGDAVPALRIDQCHPAVDGFVGDVRPGDRERQPARLRLDRAVVRQRRAAQLRQRLPARCLSGNRPRQGRCPGVEPQRSATSPIRSARRKPSAGSSTCSQELNAEQLRTSAGDTELEAVVSSYELAWRMQSHAPDVLDLSRETAETQALYGIGDAAHRQLRPAMPDGPPALRGGGALRSGDLRRQHRQPGLGPALQPAQARRPRPCRRSADRRAARRPEAHAGFSTTRSSGGAASSAARPTPRRTAPAATTTRAASPSGWPAAASSPASRSARPTSSATSPCRTKSTCTTCTPRSCTCSASTTRS